MSDRPPAGGEFKGADVGSGSLAARHLSPLKVS